MKTVKMTAGQAWVKFLDNQYVEFDGVESKFVDGVFTIFGHGCVLGIGQALDENPGNLKVYQGRNEQGMAHAAIGFAKQHNRRKLIACVSSIGPGAANMVTAAATATVNNIPLLLCPGDVFASRQPDPVLQQLEQPWSLDITTNDAFKPVCRYWDRVNRPEILMTALINAMRVLTDPSMTGAVCIAMPQDVQGETYDYPESFFAKRVHRINRTLATEEDLSCGVELIKNKKKPLVIVGGGVRYSEAGKEIQELCQKFNIPMAETQAGKSAVPASFSHNLGGVGVTGNSAANNIAREADLIIGVGTRFSDFTTGSKELFSNENVKVLTINTSTFHANKLDAQAIIGDAKVTVKSLAEKLAKISYKTAYQQEINQAKEGWNQEMKRLANIQYSSSGFVPEVTAMDIRTIPEFAKLSGTDICQTSALYTIRNNIAKDSIITGASGSLPGCLQRMWDTDALYSYNMEYGYSCMGYEIAAALGSKLAEPEKEVYSMVGDGSFLMLHSEIATAIQEGCKINILLFDNSGFGCINNLQMSQGIDSLATEFRKRDPKTKKLTGDLILIDYAKIASGYGMKSYTVKNIKELITALEDAKKQTTSTLIDIKVLPKTMTHGYNSWWNIGVAQCSGKESILKAAAEKNKHFAKARKY